MDIRTGYFSEEIVSEKLIYEKPIDGIWSETFPGTVPLENHLVQVTSKCLSTQPVYLV